jgi:selenocysteine-specific elongation factor
VRSVVIGTAGHIDHGKSALVRALTGIDPDRLKEEKERGITIDLGFAHVEIEATTFAFVDVPGHERFVKNMLAGASGIDAVLLVVAADESVMPQTREHFEICRLLGVPRGLVALTKADLVDEEMLELARLEVRELVAGSFLEQAPILAVSSRTGAGLDELRRALVALAHAVPGRPVEGAVRLPIDRAFSVKGFGTVVTGTLASGRLSLEADVVLLPAGRRVKVRGLQVHGRKQVEVVAGQRVAVNLGGIDVGEVARGDTLAAPGTLEPTRRFDAVLELLPSARPLKHGARVRFHHGTSEVLGRVSVVGLRRPADPAAEGAPPDTIEAGREAYVRIRLEQPATITRGDRFIIRAYSPPVTIGGGQVLDPHPPRGSIRTPAARARFERLDPGRPGPDDEATRERALMTMIDERGAVGLSLREIVSRAGVWPDRAAQVASRLAERGAVVRAGDVLVAAPVAEELKARLVAELAAYHRAHPLEEGMPREEARARLCGRAEPALFDQLVQSLIEAGAVRGRDRLALSSHRLALSDADARACHLVEDLFRQAGLRPPDVSSVAALTGLPADQIERAVKVLLRQKALVRVETLLFHRAALDALREDVARLKAAAAGEVRLDVGTFKDRYGITRKFAIPLLEYLDRERVTRRVGDTRVIL